MYINFLEKSNSKQLMEEIVRETYENYKVLFSTLLIDGFKYGIKAWSNLLFRNATGSSKV